MTAFRHTKLDFPLTGIARLSLDHAEHSLNVLSRDLLEEIDAHLDALSERTDIVGLVITSAKPGSFIAGADLKEFAASLDQPADVIIAVSQEGKDLFRRLSTCSYVTVACIDGICVGGGLELAIWCDRRIVTDNPKTQLGFPEVKLGLFPGWGGTVRTPRVIGLANAVEMITSTANSSGVEAYKMGLADDIVPAGEKVEDHLLEAAARMIHADRAAGTYLANRERWNQPIAMTETELAFLGATAVAMIQKETGGHYPAPVVALELLLESSMVDADAASKMESEQFAPLFGSPINRSLLNVFFLQDRNKNGAGASRKTKEQSLGVIGAGTMGQGIAAVGLRRGVDVLLADNRSDALAAGEKSVLKEAAYDREKKGPDLEKVLDLGQHLGTVTESTEVGGCDIVVEAIIEDAAIKQKLFAGIEPIAKDSTVLCSNTSTIPITKLASGLKHPERFCGLHFFNPVRKMPLIEVIRGEKSSDETIERAAAFARQLGKFPVVVNDGPGFLVNRLLLPYMNEAAVLLGEGATIKAIDKTAKEFGMPMGPIELHDVVGLDVCLHAGKVLQEAFSDRVVPTPVVDKLVSAGRLGQKNGKGFFDWKKDKRGRWKKEPSAEADAIIAQLADSASQSHDLTDRLLLPMLVEATRAVEEGIVDDVRDVDLALIMGIGFPPFLGGLFFWADQVGADTIVEKLEQLKSLGKRYEPTKMILNRAKEGSKFYAR
ncbi:3-hydroxyacyl-CoA dehydrogenase NAD-binding domain-containing protein [Aeoliella sp. ICT_H6.2]|uniref:enoyl-CoA hydratase n=1 Tax=Aeoliella straminimaris TaxID=2954799 RepID=A0A9X2JFG5_9BACT|nr:3-hydroxyacyl-CoA dehydrogenase NAD-binding domain-containing protein [Aeoliella straminimaris]MCO6042433.1 3-hydroxyacyl-CoA dehydrogenase NAD-binding domain-containing protein [Aeoliella straminimaris]